MKEELTRVRLARPEEMPQILRIYDLARAYMRLSGNLTQWANAYPGESLLRDDMEKGRLYVLETEQGRICACFMFAVGEDPTYARIYDGAWSLDAPYGVIHRIAGDGSVRGVLGRCVAFASRQCRYLRIDTHEDNLPMQRALAAQMFTRRGVILLSDGSPRWAYDRFFSE